MDVPENFCHFFNQVHSAKVEGKPSNPLISLASFARFVVPLCLALYLVISNQDFMPMWFFHYANHVVYSIHSWPSEGLKIWEGEGQAVTYTTIFRRSNKIVSFLEVILSSQQRGNIIRKVFEMFKVLQFQIRIVDAATI